jgi:hypothetical protein
MSQWSEKPQRYSATSLLSLLRRISFLAIKPVLAHRAQTQPLGCDAGRHVHARAATQRSGRSHRALAPCGTCCGQGLPAASAACFAARATERSPSFHCLRCARGRATLRGAEHGAGCLRFLKNKCFFKGGDGSPGAQGRPPAFGAETGPKSPGAAGRDARGGWIKREFDRGLYRKTLWQLANQKRAGREPLSGDETSSSLSSCWQHRSYKGPCLAKPLLEKVGNRILAPAIDANRIDFLVILVLEFLRGRKSDATFPTRVGAHAQLRTHGVLATHNGRRHAASKRCFHFGEFPCLRTVQVRHRPPGQNGAAHCLMPLSVHLRPEHGGTQPCCR